jgi:hypothetical protein
LIAHQCISRTAYVLIRHQSVAGLSPINGSESHFLSAGVGLDESHSH